MEEINEHINAIIAKYFAGEASLEEKDELTTWIEENKEHARWFARLKDLDQAIHPSFTPSAIHTEQAHEKFMDQLRRESRNQKFRTLMIRCQRIAAILFLPIAFLATYLLAEKFSAPELTEAWQTITTPYRTYSQINLPDGSKVWLNGGSTFQYPLAFHNGNRAVKLTGEAYVEVESDKKHPFIVQTKNMNVTATGTAFNVNAFNVDSISAVTMVEGITDVDMQGTSRRMLPGEHIVYDKQKGNYTVTKTDPNKWCSWRNGKIIFENDRLEYVFHRLNQLYNVNITVCDSVINSYVYHATFTDETLPEILEMLKISTPIYYEIQKTNSNNPHAPKQQIKVFRK